MDTHIFCLGYPVLDVENYGGGKYYETPCTYNDAATVYGPIKSCKLITRKVKSLIYINLLVEDANLLLSLVIGFKVSKIYRLGQLSTQE